MPDAQELEYQKRIDQAVDAEQWDLVMVLTRELRDYKTGRNNEKRHISQKEVKND